MEELFYKYISDLISDEKNLVYEWNDNKSEIIFKKNTVEGFDITVSSDKKFIYMFTDRGYHKQFEIIYPLSETLTNVMGIVRDLLSKNMRIREYLTNKKPYKWTLEYFEDNQWKAEGSTTLIFWNYFGKKSEQVYFNDILPAREFKTT